MERFIYRIDSENSGSTNIDNVFINEYMQEAKGDYVKVYLYGMMCSQNTSDHPVHFDDIVTQIGIPKEIVREALYYWADKDLVEIKTDGSDNLYYFKHIPSLMVNRNEPKEPTELIKSDLIRAAEKLTDQATLSFPYVSAITDWLEHYHFEPDLILDLIKESVELNSFSFRDDQAKLNYIKKVAQSLHESGIKTLKEAENQRQTYKYRNRIMYQVLKKLGLNRGIMESEKQMMQNWFEIYGFDQEIIYEAVRRSNVPRVNYVNTILKNWYDQGVRTVQDIPSEEIKAKQNLTESEQLRLEAIDELEEDMIADYKRRLEKLNEE